MECHAHRSGASRSGGMPEAVSVFRLGYGTQAAQLRCGLQFPAAGSEEAGFGTPQYAVGYVHDGTGDYAGPDGRRHRLTPGSVFQRFPSTSHTVRMHSASCRCFVAVPCQVFELLELTGMASRQRPVIHVGRDAALVRRFAALAERLRACPQSDLPDVLEEMVSFIFGLHRQARKRLGSAAEDDPLSQAAQWLAEALDAPPSLPEVARRAGLSYSTFRKQFAAHYGVPPVVYRVRRRVERAMALLHQPELPLKEIAVRLGYSDVFAFSAQFRRVSGQSPSAFRRVLKAG